MVVAIGFLFGLVVEVADWMVDEPSDWVVGVDLCCWVVLGVMVVVAVSAEAGTVELMVEAMVCCTVAVVEVWAYFYLQSVTQ